jgi:hypothetical protein
MASHAQVANETAHGALINDFLWYVITAEEERYYPAPEGLDIVKFRRRPHEKLKYSVTEY